MCLQGEKFNRCWVESNPLRKDNSFSLLLKCARYCVHAYCNCSLQFLQMKYNILVSTSSSLWKWFIAPNIVISSSYCYCSCFYYFRSKDYCCHEFGKSQELWKKWLYSVQNSTSTWTSYKCLTLLMSIFCCCGCSSS